jgi:glycosyltransferase involved in cell wall biosynthesis
MNVSNWPVRRLGVVVMSAIPDDPRVRRQGDLFAAAGWSVKGFGLPGARSTPPDWVVYDPGVAPSPVDPSAAQRQNMELSGKTEKIDYSRRAPDAALAPARSRGPGGAPLLAARKATRPALRRTILFGQSAVGRLHRLAAKIAIRLHVGDWEAEYWRLDPSFGEVYRIARAHRCDVWLANDWTAIPVARKIAREQGAVLLYDTHELASDESPERWRWRLVDRPVIMAIEAACIRGARRVSCVSEGIADRLQVNYRLRERPLVVRNTPRYESFAFRPTGENVEVLYHGIVFRTRGLEACIRSVAKWRPEFRLTIRGPASPEYRASLERLVAELGLARRVRLVPPAPMIDLVREASRFDIGLFALPGHSRHNRFALPNKLFEYIMAGLAVCVSDLPEMARIVRDFDLGALIGAVEPDAIAAAVNGFDRARIDDCKKRALEAARQLNWEVEGAPLLAAAEAALAEATRLGSPAYH